MDKIDGEVDARIKDPRLRRAAKLYLCHKCSGATLRKEGHVMVLESLQFLKLATGLLLQLKRR